MSHSFSTGAIWHFGTLVAVFSCDGETKGVIVPFLPLSSTSLTCLKFVRSLDLTAVSSAATAGDISFVHACGNGCTFKKETGSRHIEGEKTRLMRTISFHHYPNNQVYLLNHFCLNHWLVKHSFMYFTAFHWLCAVTLLHCKIQL